MANTIYTCLLLFILYERVSQYNYRPLNDAFLGATIFPGRVVYLIHLRQFYDRDTGTMV